jgi:hypothetical protein
MRNLITIVCIFLSMFSFSQTVEETALFNEVNNFRKDPKSYIPLVENYIRLQGLCVEKVKNGSMVIKSGNGNQDKNNDMYNVKSLNGLARIKENIKAAEELLVILDTLVLDTVTFSLEMYEITKIHNTYLDSVKKIGHFGINGTSPSDRFSGTGYRVGEDLITLGNVGEPDYKASIMMLLIDAGIKTRGHRLMLINPNYTHGSAGISSFSKSTRGFTYDSEYCIINLGYKKGGN